MIRCIRAMRLSVLNVTDKQTERQTLQNNKTQWKL